MSNADELLLKNCRILSPGSPSETFGDILIKDGVIAAAGGSFPESGNLSVTVIDAGGLCAAPGLVDMHVHLRDPGFTQKEDLLTGCAAAAAGGVTSLAAMPNTNPVADNPETLQYIRRKAEPTGVHVYPIAAVSKDQKGEEPVDFEQLAANGAAAFSDDGRPVADAALMLFAMREAHRVGKPVISHCEDLSLIKSGIVNEGAASEKLGVGGMTGAAEEVQVAREIALAAHYSLPVHIAHISTAGSAALIRDAKRRGVPVTCETCPHYFSLDESYVLSRDADYRMNPPLRSKKDRAAILEALKDGTIDVIATDHAPHTSGEKADFERAPNGVVGLETSLSAGITFLVKPGVLTPEELIRKMSLNPARILGIPAGTLREGSVADVILFDPEETRVIDAGKLHSKSKNTPFKGMQLCGSVKLTVSGGRILYKEGGSDYAV